MDKSLVELLAKGPVQIVACFFILLFFLKMNLFVLYFVYLWQLKEYRLNRLKSHFSIPARRREFLSFFNLFTLKKIVAPRITIRVIITIGLIIYFQYLIFFFLLKPLFLATSRQLTIALIILIDLFFLYLANPLVVSLATLFVGLWLLPIRLFIFLLAKLKMARYKNLIVVGIAGSYGKTSTKEILYWLLSQHYQTIKTTENRNTLMGVSLTILLYLKKEYEVLIVEMGAYKKGEIKNICRLVSPKIGILTGINQQHLSLFKNINNIIKAKYELIESLPKDGLAVINAVNKYTYSLAKKTKGVKVRFFGRDKNFFETNLFGQCQQINIQAAVAVAQYLKVPSILIKRALKNIPLSSQVFKKIETPGGLIILDDNYSSNPDGFMAALKELKKISTNRRIVITPGIIELGKETERILNNINREIKSSAAKVYLTKGDFSRFIEGEVVDDPKKLIARLEKELKKNDVILLEGRVPEIVKKRLFRW